MITPRPHLTPRKDRPPIVTYRWQWVVARIVTPFIKHRFKARYDARWQRVSSLMASIGECKTRESLESLLGPPRYALDGQSNSTLSADGSSVTHPDIVEVYEKDGCLIDLRFESGRIESIIGVPAPTIWEILTGAIK